MRGILFALAGLVASAPATFGLSIDEAAAEYALAQGISVDDVFANSSLYTIETVTPLTSKRADAVPEADTGSRNMTSLTLDRWTIRRSLSLPSTNATGSKIDKRLQIIPHTTIEEHFDSYWDGTYEKAPEPVCDIITYGGAHYGRAYCKSVGTVYSGSISVGWKKIISAKVGVDVSESTTNCDYMGVESPKKCGCQRLWTKTAMIWHKGTMYTDTYVQMCDDSLVCGPKNKVKETRVDNIQVDAGQKDPKTGHLILHPLAKPCSDGPKTCSPLSWGCRQ